MEAKLCITALFMSVLCLSSLYAADEPENILIDPGFEEIGKEEDLIPGTAGVWQVRGSDTGLAKPTIDDKEFVEGEQSIYIKSIKAGWTDMQQGWWTGAKHFVLEDGETYTLSAWMKTSVPGNVSIKLISWMEPWTSCGVETVTVTTSWAEYHVTCTSQELTERPWCEFRFMTMEDIWIDHARLYLGKYVRSRGTHSVTPQDKLAFAWGEIKELH